MKDDRPAALPKRLILAMNEFGPNTPRALVDYVIHLVGRTPDCDAAEALREDRQGFLESLDALFAHGARVLSLSPAQILQRTDLNQKDDPPDRLDSTIAELRAVAFLDNEGHTNIELLSRAKQKKSPDGRSWRNGIEFVWEVRCKTGLYREDLHPDNGSPLPLQDRPSEREQRLRRIITEAWAEKKGQLPSDSGFSGHIALIVVLNPLSLQATMDRKSFSALLAAAHQELGLDSMAHLAVVIGMCSCSKDIADDCVYPAWQAGVSTDAC